MRVIVCYNNIVFMQNKDSHDKENNRGSIQNKDI